MHPKWLIALSAVTLLLNSGAASLTTTDAFPSSHHRRIAIISRTTENDPSRRGRRPWAAALSAVSHCNTQQQQQQQQQGEGPFLSSSLRPRGGVAGPNDQLKRQLQRKPPSALFASADSEPGGTGTASVSEENKDVATATAPAAAATSTTADEYSFFDQATIYVRAGSGGQGASTFKRNKRGGDGPPDGGSGGRGGDVILVVDPSLNTLAGLSNAWRPNSYGGSGAATSKRPGGGAFIRSFRAENGAPGDRQCKNGKYGKVCVIRVPPGTVVQERVADGGTDTDDSDTTPALVVPVGSLSGPSDRIIAAYGGTGGEGTGVLLRSNKQHRTRVAAAGGERKTLELTLQVVADVALVAVPNAGKSTLLAAVTRAKPKISDYPFTTVIPNLGVWVPPGSYGDGAGDDYEDSGGGGSGSGSDGLVLCDVPGLIEGASQGVGLGHAFLRHVERCHAILHLIDATSSDPTGDYEMINQEIVKYGSSRLAHIPQVVVVNKIDALDEDEDENKIARAQIEAKLLEVMPHSRLMWMSAKERDGVDDLMLRLASFVKKVKAASATSAASTSSSSS